jgi:uncharacterized membrane protein YcjF (UPF0283 family)
MFDPTDPETFWLNTTNIALGAVTLICIVAVVSVVFREVLQRVRSRVRATVHADDHAFAHPELGLTMADGGERLDRPTGRKAGTDEAKDVQRSTH